MQKEVTFDANQMIVVIEFKMRRGFSFLIDIATQPKCFSSKSM